MLPNLTRDDLFVLSAFTGWLMLFLLLIVVLMETGVGLEAFTSRMEGEDTKGWIFSITLLSILASVITGIEVTNPEKGEWRVPFGIGLSSFNMVWFAILFAHFLAVEIPPMMLFAFMAGPFYVVWLAQQTTGVAWMLLHAAPSVVAVWVFRDDLVIAVIAGAVVAILSVVYAISIKRVESAQVDRNRRLLGLILFVQGVAFAVFVSAESERHRKYVERRIELRARATDVVIEDGGAFLERASFGSPAIVMVYHAALYVPTLAFPMSGQITWSGIVAITVLSGLVVLAIMKRPVNWGLIAYVFAMQAGLAAFSGFMAIAG